MYRRYTLLVFRYQFLRNKYVKTRLFTGLLNAHQDLHPSFGLYLNGSRDYLFDEIMLDRAQRTDGLSAFRRQIDLQDGGFRVSSAIYSNNWLMSFNLQSDIPKIPMLFLFADVGWSSGGQFGYTCGLGLTLIRDVIEVYIPVYNKESASQQVWSNAWYKNICFVLKLNKLSPFHIIEQKL